MPRKTRTHVVGGDDTTTRLTPKHLNRQEFARRLYRLMLKKGWHQSELARRADLPRDSISTYIRAAAMPTPASVQKLAAALDVSAEDLLPNLVESAMDEEFPAFEMKVSEGAPGRAWVRVNRLVSMTTAVKIAELLETDNVAAVSNGS